MKISELEQHLREIADCYGDIEIFTVTDMGEPKAIGNPLVVDICDAIEEEEGSTSQKAIVFE